MSKTPAAVKAMQHRALIRLAALLGSEEKVRHYLAGRSGMNEQLPHDPNSLADELDRVLPPGQAGQSAPSTDPLVEAAARLSAAPRPALSPEALARIHATMLAGQTAHLQHPAL